MERAEPRHKGMTDRYGLLLVVLLAALVLLAVAGDSGLGRSLVLTTFAAATWLALRASQVRRRSLRVAAAVIPAVIVVSLALLAVGSARAHDIVTGALLLLLVLVAPIAIVRRFARHPVVTADTFFAAVSVYLLAAMFFATLYRLFTIISGEPFFAQTQDPDVVSYLYFSFTTITTTGYGDFTPAGDLGRMVANIEQILGQLYLIAVVAVVVQNLGQRRQTQLTEPGHEPRDGAPDHAPRGSAPAPDDPPGD